MMSTFDSQDSTTSGSSAKFKLDMNDTKDILVYKMRHGCEITSQKELCKELDKEQKWRCSKKPIPRGSSRIEVLNNDLFNEPERSQYSRYPNAKSSLASIGLPSGVYWRRLLLGHFSDLYILSPDSSPNSSTTNSPDSASKQPSPSASWNIEQEH